MKIRLFTRSASLFLTSGLLLSGLLNPLAPALASGCNNSGTSNSGLEHGSGINGEEVTICVGSTEFQPGGSETSTTVISTNSTSKTTKKKKVVAKVSVPSARASAKPRQPARVVIEPCPSSKQLQQMPSSADARQRWIQNLCSPKSVTAIQTKPKVSVSPTPKPRQSPKTVVSQKILVDTKTQPSRVDSVNGNAQFASNKLLASNYPSTPLAINQSTQFSAAAILHFRSGKIIGKQAEVRFEPSDVYWNFGDGSQGKGGTLKKSYSEPGLYLVTAKVTYLVSYRLVGETGWQTVSGSITTQSNQLWVSVEQSPAEVSDKGQGIPLLVAYPCRKFEMSFGCKI